MTKSRLKIDWSQRQVCLEQKSSLAEAHVNIGTGRARISYYDLKLKRRLPRCYVEIAVRREQKTSLPRYISRKWLGMALTGHRSLPLLLALVSVWSVHFSHTVWQQAIQSYFMGHGSSPDIINGPRPLPSRDKMFGLWASPQTPTSIYPFTDITPGMCGSAPVASLVGRASVLQEHDAVFLCEQILICVWCLAHRLTATDRRAVSNDPVHYSNVVCDGTETQLSQCSTSDNTRDCDTHLVDVAATCRNGEFLVTVKILMHVRVLSRNFWRGRRWLRWVPSSAQCGACLLPVWRGGS